MGSIERKPLDTDYDMIIVGAGISGINAAYRVQTELPSYKYTILESRGAIGGTWDLFRYPGIRSDSDLHTFGFPWRPWSDKKAIADGTSIRNYVRESAEQYGIDKKIQFHTKLLAADWSSEEQRWALSVDADGVKTTIYARFIILSTGYYDYNEPLQASIPGLDSFRGKLIHPQFWPEDYDYSNKRMIIIGSGATAITLLPIVAQKAAHVTMLQRSPSYIMALPAEDPTGNFVRRFLPNWLAFKIVRWKFLILPFLFFQFCRAFPNAARWVLKRRTSRQLPANVPQDPHFNPKYNPWEQRLCVCPDGDFFKALQRGNADVVTDTIATVTETGIETKGGQRLEADVIVTATGLKMQMAGGARLSVDGKKLSIADKFMWKGMMLQDLPNMAFVIGYTNASWTLGADATALHICRLLKHMDKTGTQSATPSVDKGESLAASPVLNLSSTYIEKAKGSLPKAGDSGPWRPRANYLTDHWVSAYGNLTRGLHYEGTAGKKVD
jgi:cation diffusion facilitator CzcD-associated flavoprotein CzcO